jgi:DNA-cytosine methyltransferase
VGTDCSGWESIVLALKSMSIPYVHCFSSDISKAVRRTIRLNFKHAGHIIYKDMCTRPVSETPSVDIYHAGFPCQPFSSAGLNRGLDDPRGKLIHKVLAYVSHHRPKLVLLENVKGLVSKHRPVLLWICGVLRDLGYLVSWKVMDARHHGLPHHRERVFIVALRLDSLASGRKHVFWPRRLPPADLASFLDQPRNSDRPTALPPATQGVARRNVQAAIRKLRHDGVDLSTCQAVVDCDSSRMHMMHGISPCLTKSRASNGGHWIIQRGRRQTVTEQERLFGLHVQPPNGGCMVALRQPRTVSNRQWGSIVGNSIPIPMLARILCKFLPAVGLTPHLADVWDSGHYHL